MRALGATPYQGCSRAKTVFALFLPRFSSGEDYDCLHFNIDDAPEMLLLTSFKEETCCDRDDRLGFLSDPPEDAEDWTLSLRASLPPVTMVAAACGDG